MKTVLKCFLEVDIQCPKRLHDFRNDLSFFPERIKIEIFEKLVANLHDKIEFYSCKKFKANFKPWDKGKKRYIE